MNVCVECGTEYNPDAKPDRCSSCGVPLLNLAKATRRTRTRAVEKALQMRKAQQSRGRFMMVGTVAGAALGAWLVHASKDMPSYAALTPVALALLGAVVGYIASGPQE